MLSVWLLINSRQLVVEFGRSQKLHMDIWLHEGLVPLALCCSRVTVSRNSYCYINQNTGMVALSKAGVHNTGAPWVGPLVSFSAADCLSLPAGLGPRERGSRTQGWTFIGAARATGQEASCLSHDPAAVAQERQIAWLLLLFRVSLTL